MTNAKSKKGNRNLAACVWTCALVLALLVVVSAGSVGAYAATYASRDPEVLLLNTSTDSELTSTLDLFDSAYVNASGQTVVASANGDKVVAPGTSGAHAFTVRNSGGAPATYKVWAEVEQDGTSTDIPLELSLVNGASSSSNLAAAGELAPGKSAVYRIAWSWPFEGSAPAASAAETAGSADTAQAIAAADARDTALGNTAVAHRTTYKVTVHMTAEESASAKSDRVLHPGNAPQTGDSFNLALPAVLAAFGLVLIVIALVPRQHSKRDRS